MKFYDIEWLADKCGTDNKYEITVKVANEARRESEQVLPDRDRNNPADERFISNVLLEIEEDKSPISVNYKPPVAPDPSTQTGQDSNITVSATPESDEIETQEQDDNSEEFEAELTETEDE